MDRTVTHKQQVAQQQTLVINACAERRHGTGADPANIRMVTTAGHKEAGIQTTTKHRCDRRDVWEMRTTMERVIAQQRVAGLQRRHHTSSHLLEQITDAVSHGTEMHWNMRRIGHQTTMEIK